MKNTQLIEVQKKQVISHILENLEKSANTESYTNADSLNLISVIGDRGFGKTTLLSSLEIEGPDDCLYVDIVKPIPVTDNELNDFGIIELIFASIYSKVKESKQLSTVQKSKINAKIEQSLSSVFNKGISKLDKLESSLSVLDGIEQQRKLTRNIKEQISEILETYKKKLLVIRIDDMDLLSNKILDNSINDIKLNP